MTNDPFGGKNRGHWCTVNDLLENTLENGTFLIFLRSSKVFTNFLLKTMISSLATSFLMWSAFSFICFNFHTFHLQNSLFNNQLSSTQSLTPQNCTLFSRIILNWTTHSLTITQQQWVVRVALLLNGTEAAQNQTALHKGKGEKKTRIYSCENFCASSDHQERWLIIFSVEFARFVCWRCARVRRPLFVAVFAEKQRNLANHRRQLKSEPRIAVCGQ